MSNSNTLAEAKFLLEENGYVVLRPGEVVVLTLNRDDIKQADFDAAGADDATLRRLAADLGMGMMDQFAGDLPFWCRHYGLPRLSRPGCPICHSVCSYEDCAICAGREVCGKCWALGGGHG